MEQWKNINWGAMKCVLGSAAVLPEMIQKLLKSSEADRKDYLYQLAGAVSNQNDLYEPAPYVIEFILDILPELSTENQENALDAILIILAASFPADLHSENGIDVFEVVQYVLQERSKQIQSLLESSSRKSRMMALSILIFTSGEDNQIKALESALREFQSDRITGRAHTQELLRKIAIVHFDEINAHAKETFLQALRAEIAQETDAYIRCELWSILIRLCRSQSSIDDIEQLFYATIAMCSNGGSEDRCVSALVSISGSLGYLPRETEISFLLRAMQVISLTKCFSSLLRDSLLATSSSSSFERSLLRKHVLLTVYSRDVFWEAEGIRDILREFQLPTTRQELGSMILKVEE
jgi:hypothetical protein